MNIDRSIEFNGVYFLESQNSRTNPIAIRPELTPPDYFAWEDTGNSKVLRITKIFLNNKSLDEKEQENLPEKIEIVDLSGQVYVLVKLTLSIFNEKLKATVAKGDHLHFNTDEELQNYYLNADFQTIG